MSELKIVPAGPPAPESPEPTAEELAERPWVQEDRCPECGEDSTEYGTSIHAMRGWKDYHDSLCSGRWGEQEDGFPTGMEMWFVQERVTRYKCGECDYDKTDSWRMHQFHYERHQERR